ncbi:hypothetical protein EVAR_44908_1 [Eumeta japonica]|uniref:Uncharacterized protein n=1 Tax=Eumeta variegata TaxID=151549 RepID=A0A4C1XNH3_EUMVA|nr:hypothetical protein EVAR_44908_1 [Eumeta japonica]
MAALFEDSFEKNYGTSVEIASYTLERRIISRTPLRCQNATTRRGIRRPSNEEKRRRGYLNYDARMQLALRPTLAAGARNN